MRAYLKQPWAIIAILAWFLGTMTLGDIIDQFYWNTRFRPSYARADQSIVLIPVYDDRPIAGKMWSDEDDVRLLRLIGSKNPRSIYFDPRDDGLLKGDIEAQLTALGPKATLVVRGTYAQLTGASLSATSTSQNSDIRMVSSVWRTNLWGYVQTAPYAVSAGGRTLPSFSAALSGKSGSDSSEFSPDFRIDPRTIPVSIDFSGATAFRQSRRGWPCRKNRRHQPRSPLPRPVAWLLRQGRAV